MTDRVGFLTRHPEIPGYEPLRLEGQNGGVVYLARQLSTDMLVHLRVDDRNWPGGSLDVYALSLCDHPNIVKVAEIGMVQGFHFHALEYTDRTLAELIEDGPISEMKAVEFARAVTSALVYAEFKYMRAVGLSPSSIRLAKDNTPKLVDLRSIGILWPTEFTSPEEVTNPLPHVPSVIYRIGATLYAMVTGEPPISFRDTDKEVEKVHAIAMGRIKPLRESASNTSKELRTLVSKCLSNNPDKRYQSILDVAKGLEGLN